MTNRENTLQTSFNPLRLKTAILTLSIIAFFTKITSVLADPGDNDMGPNHMLGNFQSYFIFIVIGLVILFLVSYLVAADANSKGENGLLWGLLVFFMPMMGLFAYVIWRAIQSSQARIPTQTSTTNPKPPTSTHVNKPYHVNQPYAPSSNSTMVQEPVPNTQGNFCTQCGHQNTPESRYCNNCGSPLRKK